MKTTEIEPLLYGGKPMNPAPCNTSFELVEAELRYGRPVVVKLEPGDGTHYCLLLVPAWAQAVAGELGRYGIRPGTATSYIIATQLNDTGGDTLYAFKDGTEVWDMKSIRHEWTRQVFAWWFKILWNRICE